MNDVDPRHGSVAGYLAGCHERCCSAAMVTYEKHRLHDTHIGRPRTIDATGTRRRIHALQALGWSFAAIAARFGSDARVLQRFTTQTVVRRTSAERLAKVYDELSMSRPEPSTMPERVSVTRTIRHAERQGWQPPLAWDNNIDDPNAKPYTERRGTRRLEAQTVDAVIVDRAMHGLKVDANEAERHEIIRRWEADGRSLNSLVDLQGWNVWLYKRKAAA